MTEVRPEEAEEMKQMALKCGFCNDPAIARIFARHGAEEAACENDMVLAMRTLAERERAGETLHVDFIDGTGIARD